jgi:hypothetical protein
MNENIEKYLEKPNTNNELNKNYHFVMPCPELCRINHLLNLIQALMIQHIDAAK